MQNFDVFGLEDFFFFCTLLRVLKLYINSFICLTLIIINLELISKKFLGLTDLFKAQTFNIHKPPKIVIVDEYKNFILRLF